MDARLGGNMFETLLSAAVVGIALVFGGFMAWQTGTGHFGSYNLTARMDNVAGLRVGSDVRISGVKVGRVSALALDAGRKALVTMQVRDDLALPADSIAAVGAQVMSDPALIITPGHAKQPIPAGGEIGAWHPKLPRRPFTGS
ncbi:MAG TPA: MlaD family protein [Rhizomicrobium sp.]|nr:MlaD family protein [Rhizomicrobium sp.]